MALDEVDQERISRVAAPTATGKGVLLRISHSSTSSNSCHTPTSSASFSSTSDCAISPKHGANPQRKHCKRLKKMHKLVEYDSDNCSQNSGYQLRRRKTVGNTVMPIDQPACAPPPVDQSKLFRSFEVEPIEHYSRVIGVPRPEYQHVLENDYSIIDECLRREGINPDSDISFRRRLGVGRGDWVCDCATPTLEEVAAGKLGCGQGCINRAVYIECGARCPAGEVCSNRQFQLRLYAPTEPYHCGPEKGWGLKAQTEIAKGSFIVEYAGEVLDFNEFRRRVRLYEKAKRVHHYFMSLGSDHYIDAGTKGNWARFVNHSCEPNAETQKWMVNGRMKIGIFALCDIPEGEEITIDYQFVQYGITAQQCYCQAPSCSGVLGVTSKHLQDKVRLKDTRAVERHISQLLTAKKLQTGVDVTFLIQVMVQEYLTRFTRLELLKVLANTDIESYLKLFRQYNGLELLASYMRDTAPTDWELKYQILICLDHIPVADQHQVQTDFGLMEFVRQWTVDPRYCRARTTPKTGPDPSQTNTNACTETPPNKVEIVAPIARHRDGVVCHGELTEDVEGQGRTNPPVEFEILTQSPPPPPPPPREAENHQLEDPPNANTIKQYSPEEEKLIIESIQNLAIRVFEKWSKLPEETYRIPRLEREETEQTILMTSGSALVSSAISPTKDDAFSSWRLLTKGSHPNRSRARRVFSRTSRRHYRGQHVHKISRSERRAQFEANMQSSAQTATSSLLALQQQTTSTTTTNPPNGDVSPHNLANISPTTMQHLILQALSRQITSDHADGADVAVSLSQTMSDLSQKFSHFLQRQDTDGLVTYLKSLSEKDKNSTRHEDSSLSTTATPLHQLESPWCSAKDSNTGMTYYYNSVTRVVQWTPPAAPTSEKKEEKKRQTKEKSNFLSSVYACNMKILKPFRLPNCLTGRLQNDDDMKYVAKKFAIAFVEKEQRRCRTGNASLQLNREMVERFRRKINLYLTAKGEVYVRRQSTLLLGTDKGSLPAVGTAERVEDCDMELDSDGEP